MKIGITCESSCDLNKEILEKYNIKIIPLVINFDSDSFIDGETITTPDIYKRFNCTGELPKTAARGIFEYEDFFEKALGDFDQIVHISLSSDFSSSYSNACKASEKFGDKVYVVDSRNLSTGYGLIALKACDLVKEGKTAREITDLLPRYAENTSASFVINTLKFLYKGGRCSALAMFGANMLKIKPMIAVKDGKMCVERKYKGKFSEVVIKYINDQLSNNTQINKERVFITYSSDEEFDIERVKQTVKSFGFNNILVTKAGCTVSSHCGPNTIGVLFIKSF